MQSRVRQVYTLSSPRSGRGASPAPPPPNHHAVRQCWVGVPRRFLRVFCCIDARLCSRCRAPLPGVARSPRPARPAAPAPDPTAPNPEPAQRPHFHTAVASGPGGFSALTLASALGAGPQGRADRPVRQARVRSDVLRRRRLEHRHRLHRALRHDPRGLQNRGRDMMCQEGITLLDRYSCVCVFARYYPFGEIRFCIRSLSPL